MPIKRITDIGIVLEDLGLNGPVHPRAGTEGALGIKPTTFTDIPPGRGQHLNPPPAETITRSAPSVNAFHPTLFGEGFRLEAISTYNFYTVDEQQVPVTDVSASLQDIPRYVSLFWKLAPLPGQKTSPTKGLRQLQLPTPIPPVIPFSDARSAVANGYVSPGTISALITTPTPPVPPPRFDEDAFLMDPTTDGEHASEHVGDAGSKFALPPPPPPDPFRVNFIDPSIAGALDRNRLAMANDHLHLTTLASLTKIVAGLEVISEFNQDVKLQNPPPDFSAPMGLPDLSYIGYVIERYDVLPSGGMVLGRTIEIDDPNLDFFIDREVLYGMKYLYRIRSIVQWVHPWTVDFEGTSTIDRMQAFSPVQTNLLASYYAGEWSDWAKTQVIDDLNPEPPDEILVRPIAGKEEITISWKVPNDPQRDISGFRLVKATVTEGRISDWSELGAFPPKNGQYVDRDVRFYKGSHQKYIYAMYSVSYHGQLSPLSEQVLAFVERSGRSRPVRQVRAKGADPMAHAAGGRIDKGTEVVASRRVSLFCRDTESRNPLLERKYLLDIRSLSTGERITVTVDSDATDVDVQGLDKVRRDGVQR